MFANVVYATSQKLKKKFNLITQKHETHALPYIFKAGS